MKINRFYIRILASIYLCFFVLGSSFASNEDTAKFLLIYSKQDTLSPVIELKSRAGSAQWACQWQKANPQGCIMDLDGQQTIKTFSHFWDYSLVEEYLRKMPYNLIVPIRWSEDFGRNKISLLNPKLPMLISNLRNTEMYSSKSILPYYEMEIGKLKIGIINMCLPVAPLAQILSIEETVAMLNEWANELKKKKDCAFVILFTSGRYTQSLNIGKQSIGVDYVVHLDIAQKEKLQTELVVKNKMNKLISLRNIEVRNNSILELSLNFFGVKSILSTNVQTVEIGK